LPGPSFTAAFATLAAIRRASLPELLSLAGIVGPLIHGPVNKDNLLRADQALRWINIAYDEKMCDGRRPFLVFDQKPYLQMDDAQSDKQAQSAHGH
jgi:hypothetical protein